MDSVSRDGLHSKKNMAVSCFSCNARKRNRPFHEWADSLSEPFKSRAVRYYEKTTGREVGQGYLRLKFDVERKRYSERPSCAGTFR